MNMLLTLLKWFQRKEEKYLMSFFKLRNYHIWSESSILD